MAAPYESGHERMLRHFCRPVRSVTKRSTDTFASCRFSLLSETGQAKVATKRVSPWMWHCPTAVRMPAPHHQP